MWRRVHAAMFRASTTSGAVIERAAFQPTMRREKHVDDEGDVDDARPRRAVGEVRDPQRVRACWR